VRVLQITDTHLSAGKRQFLANWAPLRDWIVDQRPDMTIHTGDLTGSVALLGAFVTSALPARG